MVNTAITALNISMLTAEAGWDYSKEYAAWEYFGWLRYEGGFCPVKWTVK
jgi:hypothetical protein